MSNPQTTGVELAPVAPPVTPSSPARRGAGEDGTVTGGSVLGGAGPLVTPRVIHALANPARLPWLRKWTDA